MEGTVNQVIAWLQAFVEFLTKILPTLSDLLSALQILKMVS